MKVKLNGGLAILLPPPPPIAQTSTPVRPWLLSSAPPLPLCDVWMPASVLLGNEDI